ncbi:ScyD/ScyE family protein [Leptolyngbya sp. FACHB-671]|uniref:ScyD/ScyE family protein n=1 Tax=Leptolyngbya sp. FACHB-671 TaxID=2692812 RepID=UPI00168787FD|nr:ScyD/ScyE family protein [Leptolyngbya sp. FACHB-671]MBD2068622.1 ScyD/ScyE family protein [Leptolyngbya sp. FACHB-671]
MDIASIAIAEQTYTGSNESHAPQIEVLANGLDGPRGLTFGSDGALYVTEAGRGGPGASIPSPSIPNAVLSYGATGAITRIQDGVVERVVTGLPSLALPDGSDAAGINDIEFDAYGNAYGIVGFAGNPALRDSIVQVPDFSQLITIENFDDDASWTRLVDLGAYEQANNPDGQDVNTNLFDLLIEDNTAYVLDAGGNDLLSLKAFSSAEPTLETVLPTRAAINPSTGEEIVQQSVPTSITVGPDGAFYVSELTAFPFEEGNARVYRIGEEGEPEVYAEGFTNIIDLKFDQSGGLYVLEYDADAILNGGEAGALIYVSPDGSTRNTITDELINPTGLTLGSNGDIYISNKGFVPGQGEVLRIRPEGDLSFSPDPLYEQVEHYSTTIAADGDPADVYYPVVPDATADQLPIALMLQGGLVDKADYSNYAEQVASYGFVVVVPNNERKITGPDGQEITGLLADQQQVNDVLNQIRVEDTNSNSPIFEIVDTEKLGLLGHSLGGYAGLAAIQNINDPAVSSDDYTRPPELMAGVFYGTNFQSSMNSGIFPSVDNQDIPVGLIAGTLDGVSDFGEVASTYVKLQDPPKALIIVDGANHYGITNEDNIVRDPNRPTLDQATANSAIGRWSGLFLRSHLLGDQGAFDYIYNTGGDLDPNVSVVSQNSSGF